MSDTTLAPYGTWRSPISAEMVATAGVRLSQVTVIDGDIYWLEGRPQEGGRSVVVRLGARGVEDVTPPPFNARTRAHEYGGGSFTVVDGAVVFANFADQRLYRHLPGDEPRPITPEGGWRYADFALDRGRNRLICVGEDHSVAHGGPANGLVAVPLDESGDVQVLATGADFYSTPRVSPDGQKIAWLEWYHPNMPWDGCRLRLGTLGDGSIDDIAQIAGGDEESIFQPEWSPDGTLYFVSDRSGWWNLYRRNGDLVEPMCPMEAEFGLPQWVFGLSTFAFESADSIVCFYHKDGASSLARLSLLAKTLEPVTTPYSDFGNLSAAGGQVALIGGMPGRSSEVALLRGETTTTLRRSSEVKVDDGYLSSPVPIEFPTEGGLSAHAYYYAPRNKGFAAPSGERPPMLVKSHGGPTSASSTTLRMEYQFWTSRGIAILDVNYGGSTGYGRAYRERLNGNWGVVDVDDCVNAARYLAERGLADPDRILISGGSAGGYTTLCVLTFRKGFRAGASYYGVSDLAALATDTHKFESRYLDRLVGPYPEHADLYEARSPIHHASRLSCPIIFLQGSEDRVVSPSQAETMVNALRARGLPVAYLLFEGEQHGFRRGENVRRALEAELYFYSRILGFELADQVEAVEIENLTNS